MIMMIKICDVAHWLQVGKISIAKWKGARKESVPNLLNSCSQCLHDRILEDTRKSIAPRLGLIYASSSDVH